MKLVSNTNGRPQSLWRRWLARIRHFEEAFMVTDQDIAALRMKAMELEVAALREQIVALSIAQQHVSDVRP